MEKYYTPSLDDFRTIGIEYEIKITVASVEENVERWEKFQTSFESPYPITFGHISDYDIWSPNRIRMKYLDKSDIEHLGWQQFHHPHSYSQYNIGEFELGYYDNHGTMYIDKGSESSFNGIIKNKSELKKLMQQLNIL